MVYISSHTINEENNSKQFLYLTLLEYVKNNVHYFNFCRSLEYYYLLIQDAIKYYESLGDYESCIILEKNIQEYISEIPKDTNNAITYMVEIVANRELGDFHEIDTYTLAINMHQKTGKILKDIWLLDYNVSPLRQYYIEKYNITNVDKIINTLLIKYIDALKSISETKGSL